MTATVPRPRGRPPIGDRVEIRLPAQLLSAIDDYGADNGWTRAETLRHLIYRGATELGVISVI